MARIVFDVDISATREDVVQALNTEAGLAAWWTADVTFPGGVGSEMSLGFPIAPARFFLRVDEVTDSRVAWTSVGPFPPHWAHTTIVWSLRSGVSGEDSTLNFIHGGWANDEGPYGMSAMTWGRLMDRLKNHCETGARAPLFGEA